VGSKSAAGEARLLDLVDQLYSATLEPKSWPAVMVRAADYLDAHVAEFGALDPRSGRPLFFHTAGASEELVRAFLGEYSTPERNPWLRSSIHFPPGRLLTSDLFTPITELRDTDFYREVLRPADSHQTIGITLTREPDLASSLSIYRSGRQRTFDYRDHARLLRLAPHFRRVAQLRLRLRALEQERAAALDVLDRLRLGVVLVNVRGEVSFLNRRARECIDSHDGLALHDRELSAGQSGENGVLRRLIGEAAQTGVRRGVGSGGVLRVSRPSAKRPFEVLVAPLGQGSLRAEARGSAAVVFVADPEREDETAPVMLQRLYGLTPAEAAVALAVAQGRDPRHVSDELRIGLPTVRTHLYRAMAKAGVRRQAELVRVLLTGPAGLRGD
jgi:DNA-binding CsgD family transcriptional regulator